MSLAGDEERPAAGGAGKAVGGAIDIVVNIWTPEANEIRPRRDAFFGEKMSVPVETREGVTLEQMLAKMDAAGVERSLLVATRVGRRGHPASYHIPYAMVADAVCQHPDRFSGIAGIDPHEGMAGVRELEHAVSELGFIGAHTYPHWFDLAPDDAKWYPYYASCAALEVPVQMQVGRSMVYDGRYPMPSIGRPLALDAVACDFPELKLIGIHVGIPWVDEMIAMAAKHENVFIGSDAHRPLYWPPSFVGYLDGCGRDKVLFGTDFPILDPVRTIADIGTLGLAPTTLHKLLRDNALSLYRLAPPA